MTGGSCVARAGRAVAFVLALSTASLTSLAAGAWLADGIQAETARRPTTVILVRHAEKNEHPPGGDAGLTTRGLVRAQTLARTLRESGAAAVFASRYPRARLTAEPLATALGDSVRIYDPNDIAALVRTIREEFSGRTVVVVGHGDSLPPTIVELGGPPLAKGEAIAYDRLFVLTLDPPSEPRLVRLVYGDAPR